MKAALRLLVCLLTPAVLATASEGKPIYDRLCVACHGTGGKGDGPAAGLLMIRPQDLTTGVFKIRTTEQGSLPTDDDLLRTIREGLPGTSMTGWKALLSDGEIRAVVDTVKSLSPRFSTERPRPIAMPAETATSPEAIAAGAAVYEKLECAACHGSDGRGKGARVTTFHDEQGHEIEATSLDEPFTFRGGGTPLDVWFRLKSGIAGTPMPAYSAMASDDELFELAQYVVSRARKPVWEMTAEDLRAHYAAEEEEARRNPVRHGRRIVYREGCLFCHTPIREDGSLIEELRLAGGQRWSTGAFGDFVSFNLTSDPELGIGTRTDAEIRRVITTGIRHDGTRMLPIMMPWHAYSHLGDTDLAGIVAYLRTLPPVRNRVEPIRNPSLPRYFWLKFRMMVLWEDVPLRTYPGNGGTLEGSAS